MFHREMSAIEHAATNNGLQNHRQLRTQKKIKINAQITFVLWLMETFINMFSLILLFIIGSVGRTTLTFNMILFLIVLPYIYLTNTSHNKDRIVREGWLNVLKNIFPCTRDNGTTNLTRFYTISSDTIICRNKSVNGHDILMRRVVHNESHAGTTDSHELHVPIKAECTGIGKANEESNKKEQFAPDGMKNVRPYFYSLSVFCISLTKLNLFLHNQLYCELSFKHSELVFSCKCLHALAF